MNERFAALVAEAYGRHSDKYASVLEPILTPMADEIVALAGLKSGEQILDLATGTGLIARTAANSTASVVGIDIAFGVLVRARELTADEIPYVTGDALSYLSGTNASILSHAGSAFHTFPMYQERLQRFNECFGPMAVS